MGYHNYYSDRRIIPEIAANGTRFLDSDYGNLEFHPMIERNPASGQGCEKIGTSDGVYEEIFDLTLFSGLPGLGQSIGLVKDGAVKFVNQYTDSSIKNNVSLSWGFFSASTARSDIDAGRPIVLGFQPFFTGADSFHVVPAYGYATLEGVTGFIVHYGWGAVNTHVWVPTSWFGFQLRMNVTTTQSFVETGIIVNDEFRELKCQNTGVSTLIPLYSTTTVSGGVSISLQQGTILPQNTQTSIPSIINGKTVVAIASSAFSGQTGLIQITIPNSVTTIGTNAFLNTGGSSIYIQDRTVAPPTFHYNWNPSTNPVYLNGVLCNHSTATLKNLSATVHGIMCPKCRTTTNIQNHAHIHNYTWTNYKQHRGTCECGAFKQIGHVVSSGDTGFPYKTCLQCKGPAEMGFVVLGSSPFVPFSNTVSVIYNFGEGSYVLSNGVTVLSNIDTERYLNGDLVLPEIENPIYYERFEEHYLHNHNTNCCI